MTNKLLAYILFVNSDAMQCCLGLVYKHHLILSPIYNNPALSKKQNKTDIFVSDSCDSNQPAPVPRLWGHNSSGNQTGVQGQQLITAKGDRKKMFPCIMERNLMEDIKSALYKRVSILLDTSLEFLQSQRNSKKQSATFFQYRSYIFYRASYEYFNQKL